MADEVEKHISELESKDSQVRMSAAEVLDRIVGHLMRELEDAKEALESSEANYGNIWASSYPMNVLESCAKTLRLDQNQYERVSYNVNHIKDNICKRIAPLYPYMICKICFHKFEFSPLGKFSFLSEHRYCACRNCKHIAFIHPVKRVIAVLDKNMQNYTHENSTLYVNWFSINKPFDFDEVHILNANNFDVDEFVMKIKNDVDIERARRYKNIHVAVKCEISQNSKNLLEYTFGEVKF